MPGFSFLTLCTPSSSSVAVVVHSFPLLGPVGEMCFSVAGRAVEYSSVGSLGLALPVVLEVEEVFVNGKIVVSFCFVVAVGTSELGLLLEFPARVVGSVLVPFDVVVGAVVDLFDVGVVTVVVELFDVVVATAIVLVLFDVVFAAVVVVPFDVVVAAVVVVWLDVLVAAAAAVVSLWLLEVLVDLLVPLVVPLIVGPVNGNVAGLTTVTTVGEIGCVTFVVLPRVVGAVVQIIMLN